MTSTPREVQELLANADFDTDSKAKKNFTGANCLVSMERCCLYIDTDQI